MSAPLAHGNAVRTLPVDVDTPLCSDHVNRKHALATNLVEYVDNCKLNLDMRYDPFLDPLAALVVSQLLCQSVIANFFRTISRQAGPLLGA